jgi:hypothetical protein
MQSGYRKSAGIDSSGEYDWGEPHIVAASVGGKRSIRLKG